MKRKRLNVEPSGQSIHRSAWRCSRRDGKPDPEEGKWMGAHPTGQLIDLSAGYYALQVMRDPRPHGPDLDDFPVCKQEGKLAAVLGNYADMGLTLTIRPPPFPPATCWGACGRTCGVTT